MCLMDAIYKKRNYVSSVYATTNLLPCKGILLCPSKNLFRVVTTSMTVIVLKSIENYKKLKIQLLGNPALVQNTFLLNT